MNKLETYFLCQFVKILGWEDLPFTQVIDELLSLAVEAAMDPEIYEMTYDLYPQELVNKMLTRVLVCECDDYRTPTYDEVMEVYNKLPQITEIMRSGKNFSESVFDILNETI